MLNTHKLLRPPACTPDLYATEGTSMDEVLVSAHYFLPGTNADWYVVEYSSQDDIVFGWAEIVPGGGEWGYTSFRELEEYIIYVDCIIDGENLQIPIGVEMDSSWDRTQNMREVLARRI